MPLSLPQQINPKTENEEPWISRITRDLPP